MNRDALAVAGATARSAASQLSAVAVAETVPVGAAIFWESVHMPSELAVGLPDAVVLNCRVKPTGSTDTVWFCPK